MALDFPLDLWNSAQIIAEQFGEFHIFENDLFDIDSPGGAYLADIL